MKRLVAVMLLAVLAGCNSGGAGKQAEGEKYQGRDETKKLEAASAVGYDGTAVRKTVDNTLNKNDEHNNTLNNAVKGVGDQKP